VYVTDDFNAFRIGTKEEALRYGWVSMAEGRKMFKSEEDFIKQLASITIATEEDIKEISNNTTSAWSIFRKKLQHTSVLIYSKHIFKAYIGHVLRKFIANGYQRVEFRAELVRLAHYD